jgi:hypothetical protein
VGRPFEHEGLAVVPLADGLLVHAELGGEPPGLAGQRGPPPGSGRPRPPPSPSP